MHALPPAPINKFADIHVHGFISLQTEIQLEYLQVTSSYHQDFAEAHSFCKSVTVGFAANKRNHMEQPPMYNPPPPPRYIQSCRTYG